MGGRKKEGGMRTELTRPEADGEAAREEIKDRGEVRKNALIFWVLFKFGGKNQGN